MKNIGGIDPEVFHGKSPNLARLERGIVPQPAPHDEGAVQEGDPDRLRRGFRGCPRPGEHGRDIKCALAQESPRRVKIVDPGEHVVPHRNGIARKDLNVLRTDELARALALAADPRRQLAGGFEEEHRLLTAGVNEDPAVRKSGQPLNTPDELGGIIRRFDHDGTTDHEFGLRIHAPERGVVPRGRMILDDFDAGGVPHRDAGGLGGGRGPVAGGRGDSHGGNGCDGYACGGNRREDPLSEQLVTEQLVTLFRPAAAKPIVPGLSFRPPGDTLKRPRRRRPGGFDNYKRRELVMSHARTALAVLVTLTLAACGDNTAPPIVELSIDTLADGSVLVSNPVHGLWDADPDARWRLVESLRIGTATAGGPEAFESINRITIDALDRLWVVDYQAGHVKVFDAEGRYVRTIGRSGEGPGEFIRLSSVLRGPNGNMWIADGRLRRYEIFDTAGTRIRRTSVCDSVERRLD